MPNEALYGDLRICSLISCTYLLNFNICRVSFCSHARNVVISPCSSFSTLRFWPHFLLKTPRIQGFVHVLLGIGTLGRRVAPLSRQYAFP